MTTDLTRAAVCLACGSDEVRDHPASRVTGTVIRECRSCGLRAVRDRQTPEYYATLKYDGDVASFETWASTLRADRLASRHREALARLTELVDVRHPSLFDVGAGDGDFLATAQRAGFRPHGNELWPGAIERARELRGIELLQGELRHLQDPGSHDVVTMWCVLAHVPDEDDLLRRVRMILKPGGILILQTPRYSMLDTIAMALHDLSRGRWTRVSDRRLADHHMSLHTEKSIRHLLNRHGFEVMTVEARARWGFTTEAYMESMRLPRPIALIATKVVDALVERDWFFRNALDVYARRPDGRSSESV